MNDYLTSIQVLSTDRTNKVLSKIAVDINLPIEYISYFSLFLVKEEDNGDISILRKLQDFESPYISQKSIHEYNKIAIRKR